MSRKRFASFAILTALGPWAVAPPARADLAACGDIHVEASARCEVVPPGLECEGMCEPLSVRAACAAQLDAECQGSCRELPTVDCQGECTGSCTARCEKLEPGDFGCEGDCKADCSGSCQGRCETAEDSAQCEASCTASCDAECHGSCDIELPEADCDAGCEASCEGSCDVDANFDCQVDCQAEGFAECETDLEGGCDIACEGEEGALFCDGQYVDHGDNLQKCVAALEAVLDLEVETHAEASCEDNRCEASAGAKVSSGGVSCTAAPGSRRGAGTGWLTCAIGMLVGAMAARRRGSLRE